VRIRIVLPTLGLLLAPSTISFPCSAQTQVEMHNEEGLKGNPAGVKVVLRTKDGRSTFRLFETIPVELDFSSAAPSAYSIELDETMNFAGSANRFEVSFTDADERRGMLLYDPQFAPWHGLSLAQSGEGVKRL
jgi:hypothetical protein